MQGVFVKIWRQKSYCYQLFLLFLPLTLALHLSSELTPFLGGFSLQDGRWLPTETGLLHSEHQLGNRGLLSWSIQQKAREKFWLVLEGINHYGQNMWHYDRPAWNTHKTSEPRLNCTQTPAGLRLGKGGSLQQWACWFQTTGIILGKEPNVCSLNHFTAKFWGEHLVLASMYEQHLVNGGNK